MQHSSAPAPPSSEEEKEEQENHTAMPHQSSAQTPAISTAPLDPGSGVLLGRY